MVYLARINFLRAITLLVALIPTWPASAQDAPVNASLVGRWNGYTGDYADVWAQGDYAYVPNWTLIDGATARVHILDISDPTNPTPVAIFFLPSPNQFRSPQDVKVANGLLFIALEGSGSTDGVVIVDVRDPTSPVFLTTIAIPGFPVIHNVFYDSGFLYLAESKLSSARVAIVDLRLFDPDNPPGSPITTVKWIVDNIGAVFVHDVTVRNDRMYAAGWTNGLWVYDVSDVANSAPVLLGNVGGNATHAMWPTDDGKFVVVGEERTNGGILVYEMVDNGGSIDLELRDSLVLIGDSFSTHNPVVVGNRVYISWYQAGLRVFDVNPSTGKLEFVASFDTSPFANTGTFNGCWGVYPFLGSDKVLLTDLEEGFFVVEVTGPLLRFSYPEGLVDFADPAGGTELRVQITDLAGIADPNTAQLFISVDGSSFAPVPMSFDGSAFVGQFPPASCGSLLEYYVQVETTEGEVVVDPLDAPTDIYRAIAATGTIPVIVFDFETAPGWSVSGDAVDGQWDRGVPIGEGVRGDPPSDFDGSGQCFLTDNVAGNSDVDAGTTVLTSPVLDASMLTHPFLRYARWYSNTVGASPEEDVFVVELSDDGGTSWFNLETVGPSGREVAGGWFQPIFRILDSVAVENLGSVRVRFSASDLAGGSVVEAGVDGVELFDLECVSTCQAAEVPNVEADGIAKSRTISFQPGSASRLTALQVELTDALPGFTSFEGATFWVGPPTAVTETSGSAAGVPEPSYISAELRCTPHCADWGSLGVVHVSDQAILPGSFYSVRAIDCACDDSLESNYSLGLPIETSLFGDVVGNAASTPPDQIVDFFDIQELVRKFRNLSDTPSKATADLAPEQPDRVIDFRDIQQMVSAFSGDGYSFEWPTTCP